MQALADNKVKLLKWYKDTTGNDEDETVISDKLGFNEWIRVCDRQDLVGQWEVEQLSEITGDSSASATIQCRLSIVTCKAAFMDSQSGELVGAGQGDALSESGLLDFTEFQECIARVGVAKYRAVKAFTMGQAVASMILNLIGEKTEEEVMQDGTFIRAERFDFGSEAKALPGQSAEVFQQWGAQWPLVNLEGLHGFPLWEKEVHDLLQPRFSELQSIFRAYACGTISADAGANDVMDMEEFNDFAIECVGLITKEYGFNVMANQFSKSDGLSSKDKVLDLTEFVALLVRISFYRANPAFGLLAKDAQSASKLAEHAVQLVTLPGCLEALLLQHVMPHARRDNLHI